jgi:hypothetical protein
VCRVAAFGRASRKYHFTDELREELRAAYRLKKHPRARAIERLMKRTGWPKHAFGREALQMGLPTHHRHPAWKPEEDTYLQEKAGRLSVRRIALRMGRSMRAVETRIYVLSISRKERREGYCIKDLREVFGVTAERVKGWMDRGLLGKVQELGGLRVTEAMVRRFVRTYPHEYDLRRLDQIWFKAVVFGRWAA